MIVFAYLDVQDVVWVGKPWLCVAGNLRRIVFGHSFDGGHGNLVVVLFHVQFRLGQAALINVKCSFTTDEMVLQG